MRVGWGWPVRSWAGGSLRSRRCSARWAATVARLGRGIRGLRNIISEDGRRKRGVDCKRNCGNIEQIVQLPVQDY